MTSVNILGVALIERKVFGREKKAKKFVGYQ
ncbi:uncharacterized protein METZ01_LOCUS412305 [marine metagenome]|uniref:Uncharacterized protein n=1 Tax=marine metagenome TaxID=408172 RepID=A0A382WN25_9ZZZZ